VYEVNNSPALGSKTWTSVRDRRAQCRRRRRCRRRPACHRTRRQNNQPTCPKKEPRSKARVRDACGGSVLWEGSTTVVYTVVWRNPVVWTEGWITALWLVRKCVFLYMPSMNYQAMGSSLANQSAVFPPSHQTTGFRQTTV